MKKKDEPGESGLHPLVLRIPVKEVEKFLKKKNPPVGDDTYVYIFGRKCLRKNYPNGAMCEVDQKRQVYIIRPT